MNTQAVFKEIKDFCYKNRDPELVKKYSRYFKDEYDAYGLAKGLTEGKVIEILEREKPDMASIIELSMLLIPESKYELPATAMQFFMKMKKEYSGSSFEAISQWFDTGINNWAHSDFISMELLKVHLKKRVISVADLEPWRFSDRPYKRRACLVALIYAMKEGYPAEKVVEFTDPLMMDKVRVVHQGIGWLLRETWKKHPEVVEGFLMKWKDQSARLIFQYATEKMTKEGKERFRKMK